MPHKFTLTWINTCWDDRVWCGWYWDLRSRRKDYWYRMFWEPPVRLEPHHTIPIAPIKPPSSVDERWNCCECRGGPRSSKSRNATCALATLVDLALPTACHSEWLFIVYRNYIGAGSDLSFQSGHQSTSSPPDTLPKAIPPTLPLHLPPIRPITPPFRLSGRMSLHKLPLEDRTKRWQYWPKRR